MPDLREVGHRQTTISRHDDALAVEQPELGKVGLEASNRVLVLEHDYAVALGAAPCLAAVVDALGFLELQTNNFAELPVLEVGLGLKLLSRQ